MNPPTWPVQASHGGTPCRCSDTDARRAYAAYCAIYGPHPASSADVAKHGEDANFRKLMERGGFSRCEMDTFAPGWVEVAS